MSAREEFNRVSFAYNLLDILREKERGHDFYVGLTRLFACAQLRAVEQTRGSARDGAMIDAQRETIAPPGGEKRHLTCCRRTFKRRIDHI